MTLSVTAPSISCRREATDGSSQSADESPKMRVSIRLCDPTVFACLQCFILKKYLKHEPADRDLTVDFTRAQAAPTLGESNERRIRHASDSSLPSGAFAYPSTTPTCLRHEACECFSSLREHPLGAPAKLSFSGRRACGCHVYVDVGGVDGRTVPSRLSLFASRHAARVRTTTKARIVLELPEPSQNDQIVSFVRRRESRSGRRRAEKRSSPMCPRFLNHQPLSPARPALLFRDPNSRSTRACKSRPDTAASGGPTKLCYCIGVPFTAIRLTIDVDSITTITSETVG